MSMIQVKLSRFNNQSGQFDHIITMDLTDRQLQIGLEAFERAKRQQVHGYYKYEYTLNGEAISLYSVSPALFDPETVSV